MPDKSSNNYPRHPKYADLVKEVEELETQLRQLSKL